MTSASSVQWRAALWWGASGWTAPSMWKISCSSAYCQQGVSTWQRVRFTLTPTGNETGPYGRVLGEDRDPSDGFRLVWNYSNQALSAHLGIHATGPGGTADELIGSAHGDA